MNTNDKQRMVEDLRARLHWLTFECEEDGTDAEIRAIEDLLDILDPIEIDQEYYSAEKSLERFWASDRMQKELEEEEERTKIEAGESFAEKVVDEKVENKECNVVTKAKRAEREALTVENSEKREIAKSFVSRRVVSGKFGVLQRIAVAVILITVMLLGGTIGAYAEKNGFFHAFGKHDDRMEVITSPKVIDYKSDIQNLQEYYDIKEIPEEYRGYIWGPSTLPESMAFLRYELTQGYNWIEVSSLYEDEGKKRLIINCKIFNEEIGYYSSLYDSYTLFYEETYKDRVIEFGESVTGGDQKQIASWNEDNIQYTIKGEIEFEQIKELILEYCDYVLENK